MPAATRFAPALDTPARGGPQGTFLLVTPWPLTAVGGVSRVTIDLYDQFCAKSSLKPLVLISSWCHKRPAFRQQDGRDVVLLRVPHPWGPGGGPLRRVFNVLYHSIPAVLKIYRLLRSQRVKVVEIHYPSVSSVLFLLATRLRRDRVKMILSFHGSDARSMRDASSATKGLLRYVCRRVDAITTCSDYLRSYTCESLDLPHDAIDVVYHGIDMSLYGEAFAKTTGPLPADLAGKRIILAVGKKRRSKGHDLLIRAFDRIAASHPDVELVILGPSGDLSSNVSQLAEDSPYSDRIWILPAVSRPDILAALSRSSVFVLPSRRESMGIVLLEAGLFALPVVASRVGGIPEVIEHGVNGLLFDAEDVNGLASCLSSQLNEPRKAVTMGRALRQTVQNRFPLSETYQCMCQIMEGKHPHATIRGGG